MAKSVIGIPKTIEESEEAVLASLKEPTLFFVDNKQEKTVLVSGLLHGNEPSGFRAIVAWMKKTKQVKLPFNILFMIGNVKAATENGLFGQRFLSSQQDFNRIWNDDNTHELKTALDNALQTTNVIGGVDLHNNSGKNPVYAVVASMNKASVEIAEFLTDKVLYFGAATNTLVSFLERKGAQFVAVECGKCFTKEADNTAMKTVEKVFEFFKKKLNGEKIRTKKATLFCNITEVKVKPNCSVAVGSEADFSVRKDIEDLNFVEAPEGTVLGLTKGKALPLEILKDGTDVSSEWFNVDKGKVVMKRKGVILMATTNVDNIKKSCLLYFGKKLN